MGRKIERRRGDRSRHRRVIPARRSLAWICEECLALAGRLRSTREIDSTLNMVTRTSVDITRSFQSTLRLLDDSGKRLLTSARTGPSVHRRSSSPFKLGEGFIGWVVVHRQAAMVNSVRSDPRFVRRPGQLWTPSSIMAVPLMTERCIGVLSVARRDSRRFGDGDLQLLQLVAELSTPYLEIARLKRLNEADPLTLLHNRRHLQQRLPVEIQRARRRGKRLAAAMLDIDHFKRVNDTHGHDVGDEVLCEMAERLRRVSRASDVVVRWGGEEFFVLFLDASLTQASKVAERMRATVFEQPFETSAGPIQISISLGVAELGGKDDSARLERRADQALYRAKRSGRNRVVLSTRSGSLRSKGERGCR
ncbi:MAG: GGDEF domain-containing protein [Deltaproteobacteria bacterium]|nr:GGDEF domain-containing protein [Deltaproteobacteria bacterium]